jgi:hypothetical protein
MRQAHAPASRTDDDLPVHSFQSLLADLAIVTRNTRATADSRSAGASGAQGGKRWPPSNGGKVNGPT